MQRLPKRKRCLDVAVSSVGLLITTPIYLLIWFLIRTSSNGPAIFSQDRVGQYGVVFRMRKFRTLEWESGALDRVDHVQADDPRIVSYGKFLRSTHLDELIQLWHVLVGVMSIVGPRPHTAVEALELSKHVSGYQNRSKIPPGITGLAKVTYTDHDFSLAMYRGETHLDLEYADMVLRNYSIWSDIRIMFKTTLVMIRPAISMLRPNVVVSDFDSHEARNR